MALHAAGLRVPKTHCYDDWLPIQAPFSATMMLRASARGINFRDALEVQAASGSSLTLAVQSNEWRRRSRLAIERAPDAAWVVQPKLVGTLGGVLHLDSQGGVARLAMGPSVSKICMGATAALEAELNVRNGVYVTSRAQLSFTEFRTINKLMAEVPMLDSLQLRPYGEFEFIAVSGRIVFLQAQALGEMQ